METASEHRRWSQEQVTPLEHKRLYVFGGRDHKDQSRFTYLIIQLVLGIGESEGHLFREVQDVLQLFQVAGKRGRRC